MNTLGKVSVALVSGLLMSVPAVFAANEADQIVYVHLQEVMEKSLSGNEVRTTLEALQTAKANEVNALAKDFKKAQDELEKTRKDLTTKRTTLTADAVKKEEKRIVDLERKCEELQHKLQLAYQDADAELKAEYVRLTEALFKEQVEAIHGWAKEKNVYAVVDADSGRVLYCRETCDKTNDVLRVVDNKHKKDAVLAKAPTSAAKAATRVA